MAWTDKEAEGYPLAPDSIELKYSEDQVIEELRKYVQSTYSGHYAGDKNVQVVDLWESRGIAPEACISNILKYGNRFGLKDGYNKKDLLKIMHYTILLWHFTKDKHSPNKEGK